MFFGKVDGTPSIVFVGRVDDRVVVVGRVGRSLKSSLNSIDFSALETFHKKSTVVSISRVVGWAIKS